MSVVGVYISSQGIVVAGDTRLTNNPNKTTVHKVIKKDNVIIGWTGKLAHVATCFENYFYNDMTIRENISWCPPSRFIASIDMEYYTAISKGIDLDAIFVIATKLGSHYFLKVYDFSHVTRSHIAPEQLIAYGDSFTQFVLGLPRHRNFIEHYINNHGLSSPSDYIKVFQKMLDEGVAYDHTINNVMEYERI